MTSETTSTSVTGQFDRWPVFCLCLAVTARVLAEIVPSPFFSGVTGLLLLVFVLSQLGRISIIPRIYLVLCLALLVWAVTFGTFTFGLLLRAGDSSGFLVLLLVAAGILRTSAESSALVRTCGDIIINQPPGRRYVVLAIGGNLFAFFLSVGAINVLYTMIYRSVMGDGSDNREPDQQRIQSIRLRRMSQAAMRGFTSTALWSPVSVPIALILTAQPDLDWPVIAKAGLIAAVILLGLGWVLDRLQNPRFNIKPARPVISAPETAKHFARLLGLVMIIPLSGYAIAMGMGLKFIFGVLMAMPLISWIWFAIQSREKPRRGFGGAVATGLLDMRSEVAIFACAGFLAVVLVPQIDVRTLGEFVQSAGLSHGVVFALISWTIFCLALLGVNLVFLIALFAEVITIAPGLTLASGWGGLALTGTFVLATGAAPLSIPIRLAAMCVGRSPIEIGLKWNGVFAVLGMISLSTFLILAQ